MWGALCVRTKQTTLISVASYSFRHYCSSYHHLVDYLVDHCCRNTTLSLHLRKHGRLLSETFLRTERSLYPTLCVCLLSPKLEFECRWTLPPPSLTSSLTYVLYMWRLPFTLSLPLLRETHEPTVLQISSKNCEIGKSATVSSTSSVSGSSRNGSGFDLNFGVLVS